MRPVRALPTGGGLGGWRSSAGSGWSWMFPSSSEVPARASEQLYIRFLSDGPAPRALLVWRDPIAEMNVLVAVALTALVVLSTLHCSDASAYDKIVYHSRVRARLQGWVCSSIVIHTAYDAGFCTFICIVLSYFTLFVFWFGLWWMFHYYFWFVI